MPNVPATPDFIHHDWAPLVDAVLADGFVQLRWADGTEFDAYSLWLAENSEGFGLEPAIRESTLEPRQLPSPTELLSASVASDGALETDWAGRPTIRVHPGWLRYVAEGRHLPTSGLPDRSTWVAAEFDEPPTIDGSNILDDDVCLEHWLALLVEYGLCRLEMAPIDPDFLPQLMARIGPIRDTNFGTTWSVRLDVDPTTTANTGRDLGQHTDLPTRETPPGFQFLHCLENDVEGGWSRMSDGRAVAQAIQAEQPEAYEALTSLEWVFMNRATDAEHRWIGPIIDHGTNRRPLTLRAFYPVRSAAHMHPDDVPRAYEAIRVFSEFSADQRFQITFPFRPGDLVGFDNRRVLHGRDAFDGSGSRHLRGCYVDHDDLLSRLRVLRRPAARAAQSDHAHNDPEVSS